MRAFIILLLTLSIVSCGSVKVQNDYDKTVNFETYKTYNYYKDMNTGLSELDNKRLISMLEEGLAQKGITKSENPDFLIYLKTKDYKASGQRSNVGVGLGGGNRGLGGGLSVGIPVGGQPKQMRQITFEFVDENKTGLFWQAISESQFQDKATPEEREAQLKEIVDKVLETYPPKRK